MSKRLCAKLQGLLEENYLLSGILSRINSHSRYPAFRYISVLIGVIAFFTMLLAVGFAGQENERSEKNITPAKDMLPWQVLVETSKRGVARKNGVLLRIEVDVKKDANGGTAMIHWSIDYDGPRPPLTIFKPTLGIEGTGICAMIFYPVDKDNNPHGVGILPEGFDPVTMGLVLSHPTKDMFVTINKKEFAKGIIEVPLSQIEAAARKQYPNQFPTFSPNRMFVQLRHTPDHRGEQHGLDAWTGSLQTELVAVPIEKLPKN